MDSALRCTRDSDTSCVGPLSDDDERDLLSRVAARDMAAMRDFYFLYHGRLAHFLARVTACRELLDEIINEAFVIVWRRAAEFRGDSRVSTWLMGIVWRHCLASGHRDRGPAAAPPVLTMGQPAGEDECMNDRDALEHAMSTLSAEHRALIELAYVGGYSCDEIGVIMQCPASAVRARLFHARCWLRTQLEAAAVPCGVRAAAN